MLLPRWKVRGRAMAAVGRTAETTTSEITVWRTTAVTITVACPWRRRTRFSDVIARSVMVLRKTISSLPGSGPTSWTTLPRLQRTVIMAWTAFNTSLMTTVAASFERSGTVKLLHELLENGMLVYGYFSVSAVELAIDIPPSHDQQHRQVSSGQSCANPVPSVDRGNPLPCALHCHRRDK